MYFVFDRPQDLVFWMKGMLIPIDIIFIYRGRVVKICPDLPPPGRSGRVKTTGRPVRADAVLEVAAGQAVRGGVRLGDRVRVTPRSAEP